MRFFTAAVFTAFCLIFSLTDVNAGQPDAVAGTIQKVDRYSKGLKIGMTFSQSVKTLGAPKEKKNIPGAQGSDSAKYYATWLENDYSLDAQYGNDDRVVSYGVHWFGPKGTAPEFNDILVGEFKETELLGTRTATLDGKDTSVRWRKTPVPGMDKTMDILTVGKKLPHPGTAK